MPAQWLLIPFEENEWVQDRMADCIRLGIGVIAQDYVWTRMKGDEVRGLRSQGAKALAQQQQQKYFPVLFPSHDTQLSNRI